MAHDQKAQAVNRIIEQLGEQLAGAVRELAADAVLDALEEAGLGAIIRERLGSASPPSQLAASKEAAAPLEPTESAPRLMVRTPARSKVKLPYAPTRAIGEGKAMELDGRALRLTPESWRREALADVLAHDPFTHEIVAAKEAAAGVVWQKPDGTRFRIARSTVDLWERQWRRAEITRKPPAASTAAAEKVQPARPRSSLPLKNTAPEVEGLAPWKLEIIKPVLALPESSPERNALLMQLARKEHISPAGRARRVDLGTLLNWIRRAQRGKA